MLIEEISLVAQAKIALLSTKTHKVKGTIGINWKIQVLTLILPDTGATQNLISKSIVLPSWKSCIQRCKVWRLPTAKEKPLELERFLLQLVYIGDLEEQVGFEVCKWAYRRRTCRDFFDKSICAEHFRFLT